MPESDNHNKPLVLLVENDQPSRDVTKFFLKDICNIEFAFDSAEALEKINSKNFSAVLMDINLGRGMNGIQLTQEIKKIKGYENTPVVSLTAYAMLGDKEKVLSAGCSHYLSKPF